MFTLHVTKDYDAMSRKAANIFAAQLVLKPDSVLGLATGSTPIGTYAQLAAYCASGDVDFSRVTTVNLDEYCGLGADDDQSYRYFMNEQLFSKINIKLENTHVPNGLAADVAAECARYDALIESLGGTDIQLLGVGNNGHIAFNEPCGEFVGPTHCVELDENTIQANARFFDNADDVPRKALTMGIRNIMHAKKIVLLASGEGKRDALQKALYGPIVPEVPASVLQLHPDMVVITDISL